MIDLHDIKKSFGDVHVLKGISLHVDSKEQCVILGSSGSGKSTLLYILGTLDKASSGQILIDQKDLGKMNDEQLALFRNENIGFVFQFHFLLPSITCEQNILLPPRISGKSLAPYKELTEMLAKYLGVTHCLKKYPYQISGGEQQRINIIRALILKPAILLCDEPTGNLDSKNSQKVVSLLKDLSLELGSTLIVVTHDQKVASQFSRKITIEDGQLIS
ncbi:MAG: ABC transporter ATP-binding protein [Halobacteriovoraceae bacterium]|nr:ABC transporter ATP-binding protein [Halobacteriovoraceae bacterium]MCB9095483.1 ABC transporter ATP-binding protein [Halobacteriovoraceae bacterium]